MKPRSWKEKFLKALEISPNVSVACKAAGISRALSYQARSKDAEFAERWDAVIEASVDDLASEAFRRAKDGSDLLTIFLLKSHRPEVYRESVKQEISGPNGGPIEMRESPPDLSKLTNAELAALNRISRRLDREVEPGDGARNDRRRRGPTKPS